ncbi:hypothetical protein ACGFZP_05150 [Kitasatospora sp. NPDC048239]|uniref:hypothetical protein n=1 Tax=Kitasatospora sp. NPDC048239 TaxID=3364046 RepID=UPI00371719C6
MHHSTLPRHPRTGLTAVGWRNARPGESGPQPIWPILGGAPEGEGEGEDEEEPDDEEEATEEEADDAPLGEAGTKALAAEKERRKAEAERRRAAEKRATDLEAQLAAAKQGDGAPDEDRIRREATTAATAHANARIISSEVRAAASGKLADPRDALRFIDLTRFEVDKDGAVDEEEIADAIADLLKSKPYLAATAGADGRPRFEGTADQGARKGAAGPRQLGEADVKKMTPEQIDEAHRKGQLRDYLGG